LRDGRHLDIPVGFIIYDDTDQKDLIKQIIEKMNLSDEKFNPSSILNGIGDIKNQMISPQEYLNMAHGSWQELVAKIYVEYDKALKNNGALDFDDLMIRTLELFIKHKDILEKWQNQLTHIFVDEWQDTNKIQYALTKLLVGKNKNITAVGDASQCLPPNTLISTPSGNKKISDIKNWFSATGRVY
jgi:DNA helicase-2/ATP-dependent DNA helicase PcrA